jgi:pSer/pThr/pTyr-binding forkhead associated (FHA) protein
MPPFWKALTDLITAVITLTAITSGIVPPIRVLKLSPECQTVLVGRASKSVSKGLISAGDNAWFDNPVMSRDHAELILKQEDMVCVLMPVLWTC